MAKIKIYKRSTGSYPNGDQIGGLLGDYSTDTVKPESIGLLMQLLGQTTSSLVAPNNRNAANAINNITGLAGLGTQIAPGIGTAVGAGAGILMSAIQGRAMAKEERKQNKIYVMNQQAENTVYNRDIGLNPFITAFGGYMDDGGVAVQAEKYQGQPEYIQSGNNLFPTNADTSHENMGSEATDEVNQGDFIFSARNKLTKKQWEAVAMVLQNQGKNVNPQVIEYLTKNSRSKSISPAAMAEKVDKLSNPVYTPTIFHDNTQKLNERNKQMLLEQIKILNQAINPDKQDQANALPSAMEEGSRQAPWGGYFPDGNLVPGTPPPATPQTNCGEQIAIGLANGRYKITQFCSNGCVPDNKKLPPENAVKDQEYRTPCVPSGGGGNTTPPSVTKCKWPVSGKESTVGGGCFMSGSTTDRGTIIANAKGECECSKTPSNPGMPKTPNDSKTPKPPGPDNNPGLPGQGTPGDKREQDMKKCAECINRKMNNAMQPPPLTPFLPGQAPMPGVTYNITREQAAKECGCPNHLSADTTFIYDECASCMKELQAAAKASGKEISNMDAMEQCNCGASEDDKNGLNEFLGGKNGAELLGLKVLADSALAGATMRQKMYDLSQFNMTPTLNMVDKLDPTGGINKIERTGRNIINSLAGQLPFGMLAANAQGIQAQVGNQVGDFMSKLNEVNVNLKNQKQAAMQGQLDQNRQYVQNWLIDKTKRDNDAILAPARAMQSSTKEILEWYKDVAAREGQQAALKSLMETLGLQV